MKDIKQIAEEKYPYPFATEDYPTTVDASGSVLGEIDKLREAFIAGSQYGKEWVSVETELPPIDQTDTWNIENKISERVIVWMEGESSFHLGRYYHNSGRWSLEGYIGFDQKRVRLFMRVINPYPTKRTQNHKP